MNQLSNYRRLFGLIGCPLSHSFSKRYFREKFRKSGIEDAYYELFPIPTIEELPALIARHSNLVGLNVTIPYKQAVLPFLDRLDEGAREVGAVNTIHLVNGGQVGYNTDVLGFERSLLEWLGEERYQEKSFRALVLGTGGAAKAVAYVLRRLGISYQLVSRTSGQGRLSYREVTDAMLEAHALVVNTTPLGMAPNTAACPDLPYRSLGAHHFLYDLVYNPEITTFMKRGLAQGAKVKNGLDMLYGQAEEAWSIWSR